MGERATAVRMAPVRVPNWEAMSTGRRPTRSDSRPRMGAPTNWAAKKRLVRPAISMPESLKKPSA
jgi:hypothetical protein